MSGRYASPEIVKKAGIVGVWKKEFEDGTDTSFITDRVLQPAEKGFQWKHDFVCHHDDRHKKVKHDTVTEVPWMFVWVLYV